MARGGRPASSTGDNALKTFRELNLDLEKQLREAIDKQHDAMSETMKLAKRNKELQKKLRDIYQTALKAEADCNEVEDTSTECMQQKQPEPRLGDSEENEAMRESNLSAARSNCPRVVSEKDFEISRRQATIDQLQTVRDYHKNE